MIKITEAVSRHIMEVYEGNWSEINLQDVLADIDYTEATEQVPGFKNTIASLVYHITFYNEIMVERLYGEWPEINSANGFDMDPVTNEEDWQILKMRNYESFAVLAGMVRKLKPERLGHPIIQGRDQTYKSLHGVVEHAFYHMGQIVLLKKLIIYNRQHGTGS